MIYETHVWLGGEIIKPSTHFETGLQRIFCPDCGEEKVEVLPVRSEHEYGFWIEHDDMQHRRECSCGDVSYSDHFFGSSGMVCVHCGYDKSVDGNPEESDTSDTTDVSSNAPETSDMPLNTTERPEEQITTSETVQTEDVLSCESTVSLGSGILLLLSIGVAGVCLKKKES